jgi:transcriptional regulator with XRE-family HTH domain
VSQIETGRRSIKIEELAAFADMCNVPRSYLLGESEARDDTVDLLASILAELPDENVNVLMQALHVLRTQRKDGQSR